MTNSEIFQLPISYFLFPIPYFPTPYSLFPISPLPMNTLFYIGLGFTAFALIQFLSFTGTAFPGTRGGVVLLLLLIAGAIAAAGLINWSGLKLKGFHVDSLLDFVPSIVLGLLFLIAVICGIYIGI